MDSIWAKLDHDERYGVFDAVVEGFTSPDVATGSLIGQLLIPIPFLGAALGGMAGGMVAGSRMDHQAKGLADQLEARYRHFLNVVDADLENQILPSLKRDYARLHPGLSSLYSLVDDPEILFLLGVGLLIVFLVACIGIGAVLLIGGVSGIGVLIAIVLAWFA